MTTTVAFCIKTDNSNSKLKWKPQKYIYHVVVRNQKYRTLMSIDSTRDVPSTKIN